MIIISHNDPKKGVGVTKNTTKYREPCDRDTSGTWRSFCEEGILNEPGPRIKVRNVQGLRVSSSDTVITCVAISRSSSGTANSSVEGSWAVSISPLKSLFSSLRSTFSSRGDQEAFSWTTSPLVRFSTAIETEDVRGGVPAFSL